MAFTTADLAVVERAIARGETEVRFADRTVRYRSIEELLSARDAIKTDIARSQSAQAGSRRIKLYHAGKGF